MDEARNRKIGDQMGALRTAYLKGAGARLAKLDTCLQRLRADASEGEALRDLMTGFHRMAGSGGTFGLDEVTDLAGRGEEAAGSLIGAGQKPGPREIELFESLVAALRAAFEEGQEALPLQVVAPSQTAKEVLVVEDDPETARALRGELAGTGFSVKVVATCNDARAAVAERFPDALLTEILLRDGSGYDLVRWFRDQPGGDLLPVLTVGVPNEFLDKVEALTCGADGFVAKPLGPADLARRLSELLSKRLAPSARILAVEDDRDQADFLQVVLESAGYEVRTCGDPAHFERELAEYRPDLVVMDVDLPGVSGIDLVRFLRQEDAYRTLPAIFLTRHSGADQQVSAMRGGGDDFIAKPASPARILASVAARVEKARLLQDLVEHDGLTGLLTHSAFLERAKGVLLKRRRRHPESVALVMLDMDHFKPVNDRYGHPTGDRVLASLGAFLRKTLRQSDVLGRYGGEEFALLVEDLEPDEVERLVGRLLEEFASFRHRAPDGKPFTVTFSAGVAHLGRGYETLEQWLSAADAALYEAKAAGRNCLRRAMAPGPVSEGVEPVPPPQLGAILAQCQDDSVLAALPVGVILVGEDGVILWCNACAERILGASVGHLPGTHFQGQLRDPVHEDGAPFLKDDLPSARALREGHPVSGSVVGWSGADGAKGWLSVSAQPLFHAGKAAPSGAVVCVEDITLRRRIHEDLRKLTTAVVNNPASIVITDARGNIEYVNPKFEQVTGYKSEEVLGRNPRLLKSGMQGQEFYKRMWQDLASGQEWRGEFHNRRKDGTFYWELSSIAGTKDETGRITHFVAVKEDITARKEVEEQLRLNEARIRFLLDHAMNGLVAVNEAGTIESANPAAEEMFGYASGEMLGLPLALLLQDVVDREIARHEFPSKRTVAECQALRKGGSPFPVRLSLFRVPTSRGTHLKVEVEDLTELLSAERMKREFVSVVSHELRTPLTSIRGSLGLLAGGVAGEFSGAARDLVSIALKNCERLTRLINDILDLEKSESGKMEFCLAPVEIMEALGRAVEANAAFAVQFGVRLVLLGGPEGLSVLADADRLEQVLANLISNAAKFSPAGSAVEVWAEARDAGARVFVKNYGAGIREEFREHIFNPFAQADRSDSRKKGGTGLGLSICKAMVEGMGGSIGFETSGERGTVFYFDLSLPEEHLSAQGEGA